MDIQDGIAAGVESPFVSTGRLPSVELVQQLVGEAHERYRTNADGATSDVYPALGEYRAGCSESASRGSAATSTPRETRRRSSRS